MEILIGNTYSEYAVEALEQIVGPRVAVDIGVVLVMTEKQPDGKFITIAQSTMEKKYTSEFLAQQPDGELPLYMDQGGVRSKGFSKEEKELFKRHCCCTFPGLDTFKGYAKLFIQNGVVDQVRFEPI
jgi:hypothetical protein